MEESRSFNTTHIPFDDKPTAEDVDNITATPIKKGHLGLFTNTCRSTKVKKVSQYVNGADILSLS